MGAAPPPRTLSRKQISIYLKQAGKSLVGVRTVLQEDDTLWELLETPLMLGIVARTYQGQSAKAVQMTGSLEQRRTYLFENYTKKMFERRSKVTDYTPEQTIRWLTWLASSLIRNRAIGNNLDPFYVERMQPDWLPSRTHRWLVALSPIMFSVLVLALVNGLLITLVEGFIYGLTGGLLGLVFGLGVGLTGVLADGLKAGLNRITPTEGLRWSWREARQYSIGGLAFWLIFGMIFELVLALVSGLVGRVVSDAHAHIVYMPPAALLVSGLAFRWSLWLSIGLVSALIFGLVGGLNTGQIIIRTIPNEGILRSLRSALITFLIVGLIVGLIGGLIDGLRSGLVGGLPYGLVVGLMSGLVYGLIGGLVNGGSAYLKHYVLRILLWLSDYAPWNYVRFLDYAAERVFLLKIGGGYKFTHDLLMEYFRELQSTDNRANQDRLAIPA